jgi:hypothetical protein
MAPLLPCAHCRRHVFAGEPACRFCGSTIARPLAATLIVASALSLASCQTKYGAPPPPEESARPNPSASASASSKPKIDDNGSQAEVYGAPPPPSSSARDR